MRKAVAAAINDAEVPDVNGLALKAMSLGKDLFRKGKNVVLNVSDMESKVRDATSGEKWGPSGTLLNEISMATTDPAHLEVVLQCLWDRLKESGSSWRKCYKALNVIDYCLKNGARRFVDAVRDNVDRIEACKRFQYIEPDTGRDQGLNVREKCKALVDLIESPQRL
eukprot:CAMPEP_0174918754 /NCGR_PEP_ID=MMETSP1355-20121228/3266_1 /TAXON_ID=464990 /ORGANISM="Hemiselmis tepida, Strain CCMP443" /LENGTH=166 /DNA_ID=CAMNT_0016163945 /DNA_START=12 /DNA_END=509 /DNA_ORIENTATION=+